MLDTTVKDVIIQFMTIERAFRRHWGAKTVVTEVQPGHSETISTGFGINKVLTVVSSDRIRVGTIIPQYKDTPAVGPLGEIFKREDINKNSRFLSPTSRSLLSLLFGERVIFSWRKNEQLNQAI